MRRVQTSGQEADRRKTRRSSDDAPSDESGFGAGDDSSDEDEPSEGDADDDDADDDAGDYASEDDDSDGHGELDDAALERAGRGRTRGGPWEGSARAPLHPPPAVATPAAASAEGFLAGEPHRWSFDRAATAPGDGRRSGGDTRRRDERGPKGGQRAEGQNAEGAPTAASGRRACATARRRAAVAGRASSKARRRAQRAARRVAVFALDADSRGRARGARGHRASLQEPIGSKGAASRVTFRFPAATWCTCRRSYQIGISKRTASDKERARLREAIESLKPPSGGLIVRTWPGLTKKQLKADVGYLVRLWEEVAKKRDLGGRAPTPLYQELDLVLKTARDLFTDDIAQIVIDDKEQYHRLVRFVEMFMPERAKDIVLYSGDEPIFDAYGIEDEIGRALSGKVPLPSGGHLIIDQAESADGHRRQHGALRGKGSKDLEDTLFRKNPKRWRRIATSSGSAIWASHHSRLDRMDRASNREEGTPPSGRPFAKGQGQTTFEPHLRPRAHRDDTQAHA